MIRAARALACSALLIAAATPALADDPFQSGRPTAVATPLASIPGWAASGIAAVARAQSALNDAISAHLRHLSQTHSLRDLAAILALSFVFGVFHAVGPGHGKTVVASYLMARRERLASGILVGSLISLVQGLSAIAIVGMLALVLQLGQLTVLDHTTPVEIVSYALIAAIGVYMLYQAATGRGHDHWHGAGAGHDHAGGHAGPHDHRHDHAFDRSAQRRGMVRLAFAAGLVPCASAVIVMLFALANHVFVIGVEAALAMSLGMAITVSAVGLASIFARRVLQRAVAGSARGSVALERGLNVGGSLVLVIFASVLMIGAWSRL
jgi:nickel/cobalt exporter